MRPNKHSREKGLSRDTVFLSILVIITFFSVIVAGVNVALGAMVFCSYFIVILVWWASSKKNPYELVCTSCYSTTRGDLGTFLLRVHWFDKVLMTCPSCGRLGWLTATGRIKEAPDIGQSNRWCWQHRCLVHHPTVNGMIRPSIDSSLFWFFRFMDHEVGNYSCYDVEGYIDPERQSWV